MKRRTVFKHLAVASAAAWILPSCISDPKKVSIALNRLKITADDEALLGDIADVLIPPTAGESGTMPGARAVEAHLFALVMVDDCLSKEAQEQYLAGMRDFDKSVKSLTGKSFVDSGANERLQILTSFEEHLEEIDDHVKAFYNNTRRYIIQGYTTSQYFLTQVKPYQLVPGPVYDGCAPVSQDSKPIS